MNDFSFKDLLNFDKMVATVFIKVIYWIGGGLVLLAGLGAVFNSGGFMTGIMSLIALAVGLLVWRVMCELWIVIFGIHEKLGRIVALQEGAKADKTI